MNEIEIVEGWDDGHAFAVILWDRHRDAGHMMRAFADRESAIAFAQGLEAGSAAKLHTALLLPFRAHTGNGSAPNKDDIR